MTRAVALSFYFLAMTFFHLEISKWIEFICIMISVFLFDLQSLKDVQKWTQKYKDEKEEKNTILFAMTLDLIKKQGPVSYQKLFEDLPIEIHTNDFRDVLNDLKEAGWILEHEILESGPFVPGECYYEINKERVDVIWSPRPGNDYLFYGPGIDREHGIYVGEHEGGYVAEVGDVFKWFESCENPASYRPT